MNDLLVNDHSELDAARQEIFAAIDAKDAATAHRKLDYFWARLAMHIRAEHLHLFPALLDALRNSPAEEQGAASLKSVEKQIAQLKSDHDFFMRELAAAVKQIREFSASDQSSIDEKLAVVREKLSGVVRRLEVHNEVEESGVYPLADALFDPATRTDLEDRMRRELENLPPRFDGSF